MISPSRCAHKFSVVVVDHFPPRLHDREMWLDCASSDHSLQTCPVWLDLPGVASDQYSSGGHRGTQASLSRNTSVVPTKLKTNQFRHKPKATYSNKRLSDGDQRMSDSSCEITSSYMVPKSTVAIYIYIYIYIYMQIYLQRLI